MILAKPSKYIEARRKGRTAQCAESRYRENLCPDDGAFSQEYFVYFKKKRLDQGANYPADAAAVLCGVDSKKKNRMDLWSTRRIPITVLQPGKENWQHRSSKIPIVCITNRHYFTKIKVIVIKSICYAADKLHRYRRSPFQVWREYTTVKYICQ